MNVIKLYMVSSFSIDFTKWFDLHRTEKSNGYKNAPSGIYFEKRCGASIKL